MSEELKLKPTEIIMLDGKKADFKGRMDTTIVEMEDLTYDESESLFQLACDHLDLKYELKEWSSFTIRELFSHLKYGDD